MTRGGPESWPAQPSIALEECSLVLASRLSISNFPVMGKCLNSGQQSWRNQTTAAPRSPKLRGLIGAGSIGELLAQTYWRCLICAFLFGPSRRAAFCTAFYVHSGEHAGSTAGQSSELGFNQTQLNEQGVHWTLVYAFLIWQLNQECSVPMIAKQWAQRAPSFKKAPCYPS